MDSAALANILDMVPQGVVVFGLDRQILYCNQTFLDITGFDRSDLAGALCGLMQGPDTDRMAMHAIEAAIGTRNAFSGKFQNYRKSGEAYWSDLTFKPVFNDEGALRHFVMMLRDITEQRDAELQAEALRIAVGDAKHELDMLSSHFKNAKRIAKIGVFDYSVGTDLMFWSEELIEMLAFPKEKFPALSDVFASRIDEIDLPRFQELFGAAVRDGVPYEITVKVLRYDDTEIYMELVADVRDVEGDRRIIGIARDVTTETIVAKQLFDEKQRFELASRGTQDAIFEWDLVSGSFWANEAFEAVYGYPAPNRLELGNLEDISAVEAEHDRVRQITLEAIASDKQRFSVDYEFTRADGTRGHAAVRAFIVRDHRGKALRVIGTATDVGQISRTMRALEASEERFRIIADTVSDVLWDRNFDDDTMWVTPDWPARLRVAIEPKVSLEQFFLAHVDPKDALRVQQSFLRAIKSDASRWEIQYGLIGSDGERVDLAVKAAILRNPDGKAHRMLGNARNVTFETRQREGYSRSRALEAVGQLTGGVAHDFNNQLMIIQGNAELLEMSNLDEEQAESVALISQACSSSADMTQRLLSFSRQSNLKSGRVDLTRLVPNTVALLRVGIPESISVRCKMPGSIWQAAADANALEQAIVNLAVNARDAMVNGGEIIIGCENRQISGQMEPFQSELEPGDYVAVSVTDNGAGMSPDVLAKAFDPFFTTKEVGKGTGLGLSTVYGFAKQSKGHVTIYSELGRGTTITLFLPRFFEKEAETGRANANDVAHPGSGQRILVVEDQPQLRAHVEKLLTKMGYRVNVAEDGKAALSLLEKGMEFDLLFTDVIMPGGLNGQQLADQVRKRAPHTKVLYTSGYPAFAFEHLQLDEVEQVKLLRKPYRSTELSEMLAELLSA